MGSDNHSSYQLLSLNQALYTKYLLGIGISTYKDFAPLPTSINDLKAVFEALSAKYQFNQAKQKILSNEHASRRNILGMLEGMEDTQENDTIIIYFSGHCIKKSDHYFWVPSDAKHGEFSTYISTSDILDRIKDIPAKNILILSDARLSSIPTQNDINFPTHYNLDRNSYSFNRWLIYSNRHDEYTYPGQGKGNSPFTTSLLRSLWDHNDYEYRIDQLLREVQAFARDNFQMEISGGLISDHTIPEFPFILQLNKEAEQWMNLKNSSNPTSRDYDVFIQKFENSIYIPNAVEVKQNLDDDELWERTKQIHTIKAYQQYLQSNNKVKKYTKEAQKQLSNIKVLEQFQWNQTVEKLQETLRNFVLENQGGDFSGTAKEWIDQLEVHYIPHLQNGRSLEAFNRKGGIPKEIGGQNTSVFNRYNATSEPLVQSDDSTLSKWIWKNRYLMLGTLFLSIAGGTYLGVSTIRYSRQQMVTTDTIYIPRENVSKEVAESLIGTPSQNENPLVTQNEDKPNPADEIVPVSSKISEGPYQYIFSLVSPRQRLLNRSYVEKSGNLSWEKEVTLTVRPLLFKGRGILRVLITANWNFNTNRFLTSGRMLTIQSLIHENPGITWITDEVYPMDKEGTMELLFEVNQEFPEDRGIISIELLHINGSGFTLDPEQTDRMKPFQFIYEVGADIDPLLLLDK